MADFPPLGPRDAIEFFRSKGLAPVDRRFDYRDIWQEEHARHFVVAKALRDDVLTVLQERVDEALSQGGTLETFISAAQPELEKLGWWGEAIERDPKTGELVPVKLGSKHRLKVIFDTNMRTARAAGRWAQIQRTKSAFPYLEYQQIDRDTKREDHTRFDGLIRPVDDPVWEHIYPPNGYFCGCTVRQMNDRMLKREGKVVSPPFDLNELPWENTRSGATEAVPEGVAPSFNSNPGAAWLAINDRHAASTLDLPKEFHAYDRGFIKEIRARGLRDQDESLVIYDLADAENLKVIGYNRSIEGERSNVGLTPAMLEAASDASRQLVAIHNHPSSGSFSPADVGAMAHFKGLNQLVAVGLDGSIYRMSIANYRSAMARPDNLQTHIIEVVGNLLQLSVDAGLVSGIDANAIHAHLMMEVLSQTGAVNYGYSVSGRMQDALDRTKVLRSKIVGEIVAGLNG